MNADIKGALERIDKVYHLFEHKGHRMTKTEVTKILEYGIKRGYTSTGELTDSEVDEILKPEGKPQVFFGRSSLF